jgi:hypothetical protein
LLAKNLLLDVNWRFVVKVVKADFANRHHLGVLGNLAELGNPIRLQRILGVIGLHSHYRPALLGRSGKVDHPACRLEAIGDFEMTHHPSPPHALQYEGTVVIKLATTQVGMAIKKM